ncbi:sarcosine oxidase subunit alpha family protein [Devosia nitrariae]|uniref:sarcosine oxidase subunit alpha family protein n=1 Tax=Devosia nitrariae TaxID=2071872 RepID=UPI0024E14137|nr:sarcosine oxidase subunit alpha family protein [Devosia nitrariae]
MSGSRLPSGGRIDREKPIGFSFDGRSYSGYAGDTLASALLANGVSLVGRSFKYHRPRGIFSAGIEEPNALVTFGHDGRRDPNVPATMVELVEGLEAQSQNRWPSLGFDVLAVNQVFAPLLSAGFYYKTFMGPTRRAWLFYEHFIRRAAGLGKASLQPDPDRYDTEYAFTDVAIIGSGPTGLAAALSVARSGARVTLIEQDGAIGGQMLSQPSEGAAADWLAAAGADIAGFPQITVRTRSTAFGLYDGNTIGIVERRDHLGPEPGQTRQLLVLLKAQSIIFTTGAIERPLLFADNDRPGVMLASAASTYLNRFAVACGRTIVVATNNDSAYATARDFAAAGSKVTVLDARPASPLADSARKHGITVLQDHQLLAAHGSPVSAVAFRSGSSEARLSCDLLLTSAGWTPSVHLTSHLGIRPIYDARIGGFVPGSFAAGHFGAGALMGDYTTAEAIERGAAAGLGAACFCGRKAEPHAIPTPDLDEGIARDLPALAVPRRGKVFVDLQTDVTTSDIALSDREGFRSVEHLKRYTTLGMGTDQGKTSNVHAIALMALARDQSIEQTGTTTFRPPYSPVAVGVLAGRSIHGHFKPIRRTPLHDWHLRRGAEMIEVGLWKRPLFYPEHGPDVGAAAIAEMKLVRSAVGLVDVSTLGKIEVAGPDALTFLDRLYVNNLGKLQVGKGRYCVMLRDDGIVFDEGVVIRLAEERFFLTTSTMKAADVQSWMEFLAQTAWPDLRVHITSVTDEWAMLALAGPRSRDVLAAAFPDIATDDESLPKMAVVTGTFAGEVLRIQRVSYSGERAYEIHVGSRRGAALADHLMAAGQPVGVEPYGVDAMGALRIEKGFAAGSEIDGTTTLDDIGLGGLAKKSGGFAGAVLSRRPTLTNPDRRRLVGLQCLDAGRQLRTGSILFSEGAPQRGHGIGHVTAVTFSPETDKQIGLALLSGGPERIGETMLATFPVRNEMVRVRVVSPVFVDPDGARIDA